MSLTHVEMKKISQSIEVLESPQRQNQISFSLKDRDPDFAEIVEDLIQALKWTGPTPSVFTWQQRYGGLSVTDIELRVMGYPLAVWNANLAVAGGDWTVRFKLNPIINRAQDAAHKIIKQEVRKMIHLADLTGDIPRLSLDDILLRLQK